MNALIQRSAVLVVLVSLLTPLRGQGMSPALSATPAQGMDTLERGSGDRAGSSAASAPQDGPAGRVYLPWTASDKLTGPLPCPFSSPGEDCGSAGDPRMPAATVFPASDGDYAVLNTVLFFQPTKGQTFPAPRNQVAIPKIPEKLLTITNNTSRTVYPFLRDAHNTKDPSNPGQGLYDPLDPMYHEYRGYIGYVNPADKANYVGLPARATITLRVPLVFWDGARMELGVDGRYIVNDDAVVNAVPTAPNPFQYYRFEPDHTETRRVILPAESLVGAPEGTTGIVMWYRQGPPGMAKAPANDAPSQLIEWTIRDTVLSTINPNIDTQHPNYGETHANINYDVSYVDSMMLPVAMAALDAPVPVVVDNLDPRTPNPGPRLPFAWIGSSQTMEQFQAALADLTSDDPNRHGMGTYFHDEASKVDRGWTFYNFPADKFPDGLPGIKVPSGQAVFQDSPLGIHNSSYDIQNNLWMLTSGGAGPISVPGGASSMTDGVKREVTFALGEVPKVTQYMQVGMAISTNEAGFAIPPGTVVSGLIHGDVGNPSKVTGVQTSELLPSTSGSGFPSGVVLAFNRPHSDYMADAMVRVWYTWANYYVTHVTSRPQSGLPGRSLTTDDKARHNVIVLDDAADGLVPGMAVTGPGITGAGVTTIESIDTDRRTIHLSQAVGLGSAGGSYGFAAPTMAAPAIAGFEDRLLLPGFRPADNEVAGIPNVLKYGQYVYQMLSLMSQIPPSGAAPVTVQVMIACIGGLVTDVHLNGDAFHRTEVAYRDKLKSLLRSVNDYLVQSDQSLWYTDPSLPKAGLGFNAYNLDPFVWFVHRKLGLSGYGFSLDDDAADISGNHSNHLGVAIGGLNGLPNHVEWTQGAQFGPVSDPATVQSGNEIKDLPLFTYWSVSKYAPLERVAGANVSGNGVPAGTSLMEQGPLNERSFFLGQRIGRITDVSNGSPIRITSEHHGLTSGDQLTIRNINGSISGLVNGNHTIQVVDANSFDLLGSDGQGMTYDPDSPGIWFSPSGLITLPVGTQSTFTFLGPGRANTAPLTLPAGATTAVGPYANTSTLTVPAGSELAISTSSGKPSFTQQVQQITRVTDTHPGGPPKVSTVVQGVLRPVEAADALRVGVVNGLLYGSGDGSSTGIIRGDVFVSGGASGHSDSRDAHYDVADSPGGVLVAGLPDGTPGRLTVTGNVSLYGSTEAKQPGGGLLVYVKGAASPGSDYGQLTGQGKVDLRNADLALSLHGYTPQQDQSLTIITAAGGISGTFAQRDTVKANGITFHIRYLGNNVVLSPQAPFPSTAAGPSRGP